ncbi:ATP-binding protein [Asticcacaulis sp. W401b]|uniref:ATP-binding protein n=1 Tax=Asticcacaulis sp. W401b TaxID=3388666 RepID=UPI0039710BA5
MNSFLPDPTTSLLDRIKVSMVGLKMPRAIEVVDTCVSRLDRGEITALELVEQLLLEELTFREDRRIRTALRMGRLNTVKTLAGYDFSFRPSLDKARILALAELNFVERCEVGQICWQDKANAGIMHASGVGPHDRTPEVCCKAPEFSRRKRH